MLPPTTCWAPAQCQLKLGVNQYQPPPPPWPGPEGFVLPVGHWQVTLPRAGPDQPAAAGRGRQPK